MNEHAEREPIRPLSLTEAVGGPLGMAETSLPAIAFVVAYTASGQDTNTSAIVAVGLALALSVARLVRRESPRHALSGLVGVAFAAFIATRSGRAEDFFLPGLLANAAYAAAFLDLAGAAQAARADRRHEARRRGRALARRPAHAARVRPGDVRCGPGCSSLRLVVQLPLYLAGAVVALGVAKTAMGLPLFGLGLWLTWLLIRNNRVTSPAPA